MFRAVPLPIIRSLFTVHSALVYVIQVCRQLSNRTRMVLLESCLQTCMIYRVSQEERTKLREGVPYVKLYRYNPKHRCPKLNGYWDNGQIKLWTSFGSTNDSCQLVNFIYTARGFGANSADARLKCISLHVRQAGRQSASRVTSPLSIPVWCIVLRTLCITFIRMRETLQFKLMALCHSQVTLMLSTDINITETTYSCQFQCEFGNQ